jgi:3-oxoadipate enol-lactonase
MQGLTQVQHINTKIGKIAVYLDQKFLENTPILFLHGVYFDHHLWDHYVNEIYDRMIINIDMPLHGSSRTITKENWNLDDCADMLLEILDSLHIPKVIAVGHSWGSMSILRAANKAPDRFEKILLCNMPFHAATKKQNLTFGLQHSMLIFRNFYTKQAAKALFAKGSLKENPNLLERLKQSMDILSNKDIREIDRKVIIEAEDATALIQNLKVKAIALKGAEDYVPAPPNMETVIVKGGHISPLEQPHEVISLVRKLSN